MSWLKFIQGDTIAFEQIYSTYVDDLYLYGINYYADKETIIDHIHDLFVDIFNNPKIAKEVNIKYYLFSSLRRRLLRIKNSTENQNVVSLTDAMNWADEYELDKINSELKEEQIQKLQERFELLPKRQKEVLFLKYYAGLNYEQISDMMDISIETCRTLSFRGIKKLKLDLSQPEMLSLFFLYIFSK